MIKVTLAEAKRRLGELLDAVAAGKEIMITRRGRPAARIIAPPEPVSDLSEFRAKMPRLRKPSHSLIREMRDEEDIR